MEEIDFKKLTVEEFMNWYLDQYPEHQYILPSDFERTVDRLEGLAIAKRETPEHSILNQSFLLLRSTKEFFRIMKWRTDWKIRPDLLDKS